MKTLRNKRIPTGKFCIIPFSESTNQYIVVRFIFRENSQYNFRNLFKDLTFWYFWVKPKVQENTKNIYNNKNFDINQVNEFVNIQ